MRLWRLHIGTSLLTAAVLPAGAPARWLIVCPGSHKAEFNKPKDALYPDAFDNLDFVAKAGAPGTINITPSAGDWCEPGQVHGCVQRLVDAVAVRAQHHRRGH